MKSYLCSEDASLVTLNWPQPDTFLKQNKKSCYSHIKPKTYNITLLQRELQQPIFISKSMTNS